MYYYFVHWHSQMTILEAIPCYYNNHLSRFLNIRTITMKENCLAQHIKFLS